MQDWRSSMRPCTNPDRSNPSQRKFIVGSSSKVRRFALAGHLARFGISMTRQKLRDRDVDCANN
jgi:hypothetical protein